MLLQGDRRANGGAQQMGTYSIESSYGLKALSDLGEALGIKHGYRSPKPPAEINVSAFLSEVYIVAVHARDCKLDSCSVFHLDRVLHMAAHNALVACTSITRKSCVILQQP